MLLDVLGESLDSVIALEDIDNDQNDEQNITDEELFHDSNDNNIDGEEE